MENSSKYLDKTQQWIKRLVIDLNLCPFAKYSFSEGLIHYQISNYDNFRPMMEELLDLIQHLKDTDQAEISNAFVVYTEDISFEFLLDLEYSLLGLLEEAGIDTEFQTVVFHPQFRYEGEDLNAHGNFTNRSPYPMIHILRAEEVSVAIEKTENVDQIPEINAENLTKLGITKVSEVFQEDFEARVKHAVSQN